MGDVVIVFSSAESAERTGDYVANGGVKMYNLYVNALRRAGHEAYVCTFDGRYHHWLIEHAPHCSIEDVAGWIKEGREVRGVTGWLASRAFIETVGDFWYFDNEPAHTANEHRALFEELRTRIRGIAVNSAHGADWYSQILCDVTLIRDGTDTTHWKPDPAAREVGLVGYTDEGLRTLEIIEALQKSCPEARFVKAWGTEAKMLATLQRCDLFVGLNPGKHPTLGESSPRTQQEAMLAGAVVVAYDVRGNRAYLRDNAFGYLAPSGDVEALATWINMLLAHPNTKERVRAASTAFMVKYYAMDGRMEEMLQWLRL